MMTMRIMIMIIGNSDEIKSGRSNNDDNSDDCNSGGDVIDNNDNCDKYNNSE